MKDELEALARMLGRDFTDEEIALLRESEQRIERMMNNNLIDVSLRGLRKKNPAAVSPRWGKA